MLLGAIGCQDCSCKACAPCDAVCDETPDEAFAVVYQVEDNRANLTWTGDAMGPIDGPWPGFESGSSFSQTITSSNILLPGSRFPCYFRLKLWRNVGGGEGSDALASQRVTISCTQGKLDLGFLVLNAGESVEFNPNPESASENATYVFPWSGIALDDNGADRHAFPPLRSQIGGTASCADTVVSVQAHIEWTNDLIQHNLYGEFQECFNDPPNPPECTGDCDGTQTALPTELFLTISNATEETEPSNGYTVTFPDIEDTFSLPGCGLYQDAFSVTSGRMSATTQSGYSFLAIHLLGYSFTAPDPSQLWSSQGGGFIEISSADFDALLCGSVASLSGTMTIQLFLLGGVGGSYASLGSYTIDWELST